MKWIPCAVEDYYPLDAYVGDLMVFLSRIWHKVNRNEFPYVQTLGRK